MKQRWKRIVTLVLTLILVLGAGPLELLQESLTLVGVAA